MYGERVFRMRRFTCMVNGFFECGEEWYHFQQQLMVSKTIVKLYLAVLFPFLWHYNQ